MKIVVYGYSNKQHIFYSLFKILGSIGRVLFITTNPQYCQFSDDCVSTEFELGNISFYITTESIYDVVYNESEYDFIIIDAMTEVLDKDEHDIAILYDHTNLYRETIDMFSDDVNSPDIYVQVGTGDIDATDKIVDFAPAYMFAETIQRIEKDRIFYPIYNRKHIKTIATILKTITGCSVSEIKKYLKKTGVNHIENYGSKS